MDDQSTRSDSRFQPGFRFSRMDAVILLGGALTAAAIGSQHLWIGLGVLFALLHFFLFCNIVRMARLPELIWAGTFVVCCVLATAQVISWPIAFCISLASTLVLVANEMRQPRYHGVGWQAINPQLPEWWEAQQ